ncbi:hypothetical protein LJR069_004421 [Variovorax paradoxus]|uniref:hypothetical protein n=1 Tax=Variovorax paradoxus TaxID=34073 RepID=UPI003ED0DFDC
MDEISDFLRRHEALIVHCSGTPKGVGPGQSYYPEDLQSVLRGDAQGGISCSVVKPGDLFHGPTRHATGSVGLVIAPTTPSSLVAVDPRDAGSQVKDGIRSVAHERDIGVPDLDRCFAARGDHYNEWVVRDFNVIGVFIGEPASTTQPTMIDMPPESGLPPHATTGEVPLGTLDVSAEFSGLPIYTLAGGQIRQWKKNRWFSVSHADVYSPLTYAQRYRPALHQHVLPAALIRRFFSDDGKFVEVFLKPKEKLFPAGDGWKEFGKHRRWDEGAEKGFVQLETKLQLLANHIEAGQNVLSRDESQMVSAFMALIAQRSRSRGMSLPTESPFEPYDFSGMQPNERDYFEKQGIFMEGSAEQIDRAVHGMFQRMAVAQSTRTATQWCVVRAEEGQFLVSDTYEHRAVPINPNTYLIPGDEPQRWNRSQVEKFNRFVLDNADRYVFAKELSECGVGLSPTR